jgi:hypothetical protein
MNGQQKPCNQVENNCAKHCGADHCRPFYKVPPLATLLRFKHHQHSNDRRASLSAVSAVTCGHSTFPKLPKPASASSDGHHDLKLSDQIDGGKRRYWAAAVLPTRTGNSFTVSSRAPS